MSTHAIDRTAGSALQAAHGAQRPRYVAIIADGNRRWAQARGLPHHCGHEAGADTLRDRVADAVALGVRELTVYSFSTENWLRPRPEVSSLIEMLTRRIAGETPGLRLRGVRMRFIGRREGTPAALRERIEWAERITEGNSGLTLYIAFNYGGRAEILDAAARFEGTTEEEFRACLYAPEMHDPDLVIRTGEEHRLSNYLLWQAAYSELVFRDELWPDFSGGAFAACIDVYSRRGRRFGGR